MILDTELCCYCSLGREGRQAELQKLRKEEKKLRGDGLLVDMANIIGPKSQVCYFSIFLKVLLKEIIASPLFSLFMAFTKSKINCGN